MKFLRSDNGGEYVFQEFGAFCENKGVTSHFIMFKLHNKTACQRVSIGRYWIDHGVC